MTESRKGFCPRCGRGVEEVVPLTQAAAKRRCPNCGAIHYGLPDKLGRARACRNCECLYNNKTWEVLPTEEWERLPLRGPCRACQLELDMMADVVKKGGIYWRCEQCGNTGVLSADSAIAKKVREMAKIPAPESVGIDFEPGQCPVCNGTVKEKDA